jgi:hypothetical protein
MLCYKDKTYCVAACKNDRCTIRLTDQIRKEAESFGIPLSMADFSKGCYDYESIRCKRRTKKVPHKR